LEGDGEQTPINADAATPPSLQSTWFIALVVALVHKISGREAQTSGASEAGGGEDGEMATDSDVPELEYPDQEPNSSGDIKSGKIGPTAVKAGGRRRKAARKR
jgi:hypothetical protein